MAARTTPPATTTSAHLPSPGSRPKLPPEVVKVTTATIVGGIVVLFDSTIVAVGINTLAHDLDVSLDVIQWVSTAYLLALAIAVPLVGWLQRMIGSKRLWMIALCLFLIGSILCSLAWNAPSLIAFRVFQGLGGGLLMPMMMTLVMQAARGQNLGRISALIGIPIALGPILGPVFGGLILQYLHWSWLFWVNVPFGIAGLILAALWLPRSGRITAVPLDVVGLLLLAPGLGATLYGLSNVSHDGAFGRGDVWIPLACGLVLLAGFACWALPRGDRALVDLRLLGHKPLALASVLMFFSGFGLFGAMFLLPLYFQEVRGHDVLAAGMLLIPQGVGALLSRVALGRIIDRVGPMWIALPAFLITALATIPFAFSDADTSEWWLMAVLVVRGLGLGAAMIPLMSYGFTGVAQAKVPDASIVTRIFQQLGGSFGTAILATVLSGTIAGIQPGPDAHAQLAAGFDTAFWWAVGFTGAAVLISLLLPRKAQGEDTGDGAGA